MPGNLLGGRDFQTPADRQGDACKLHMGGAQAVNVVRIYQVSLMDADKAVPHLFRYLIQFAVKSIFPAAGYQKYPAPVTVEIGDIFKKEAEYPFCVLEKKLSGDISGKAGFCPGKYLKEMFRIRGFYNVIQGLLPGSLQRRSPGIL